VVWCVFREQISLISYRVRVLRRLVSRSRVYVYTLVCGFTMSVVVVWCEVWLSLLVERREYVCVCRGCGVN